jgi:hypothetical protein
MALGVNSSLAVGGGGRQGRADEWALETLVKNIRMAGTSRKTPANPPLLGLHPHYGPLPLEPGDKSA